MIKGLKTHNHLVTIFKEILNKNDLFLLYQLCFSISSMWMNNEKIAIIPKGMHLSMEVLWFKIKSQSLD